MVLAGAQPRVVYNVRRSDGTFAYPGIDESVRLKSCDDIVFEGVYEMFEQTRIPISIAKEDVKVTTDRMSRCRSDKMH